MFFISFSSSADVAFIILASLKTFKKTLNQKTSHMKTLEKRSLFIKDENQDSEDVTSAMQNLRELRRNLEDSIKKREEDLNSIDIQNNMLKEEMKNLSKSIQRLSSELAVDCQINRSHPNGLKEVADIAEVFYFHFEKESFEKLSF